MPGNNAVLSPNLGLYLGRPPLTIPKRGMRDCLNVRIKYKQVVRDNVGWGPFPDGAANPINLDNRPVTLISSFFPRNSTAQLTIFGNTTDLFEYDEANETVAYLTPRYETGTVDVTNGSATVSGTSTSWSSNLKAGDFIHVGATGERDPTSTWYEIETVDSDTQVTLTETYAGATDTGLDYTARQARTGDAEDYYETAVFYSGTDHSEGSDGDRWYATNGVDKPVAWDGSTDQVYEPDLGTMTVVRSLVVYSNIMFYINIQVAGDDRPFSIRTSAIGQPENVSTLEASEFVVHDGADPLQTGFPLGENLAIYAERSITLVQFVGSPLQFVFRTVVEGIGPRSGRAVADFGDYHRFVGPDSQYTFDGISIEETNSHVWQDLLRRMSPQRFNRILSHFDEENGELIWVVPQNSDANSQTGPPEQAYFEHYLERLGADYPDAHTRRELPATAMGFYERLTTLTWDQITDAWEDQNYRWNDQFFQAAFPFNVFGTEDGDLFIMGTRDTKNGTAMRSYVRFSRRPLGNIERKGLIRRVYPMVETLPTANHELTVALYTADQPNGRATLEKSLTYNLRQTTSRHFVSPRTIGRYVELQFETEGMGHIFSLMGYDMEIQAAGSR